MNEFNEMKRTVAWSAGPGCHGGCGVEVYLKGNEVVRVEGDPSNPWSQGRMCARCLAMTQYLYHPQRLLHPMRRVGERGENKWERVTWNEAFDTVEKKFREAIAKDGPESIVFAQGTGRDIGGAITLLAYSVGSPNWIQLGLSGHACYTPRLAATWTLVNEFLVLDASQWLEKRYDDPEYVVPKYILNWGVDLPNTCPDAFFNHWIVDLLKRGSKVIVVDPRVTWLASRSEIHLRVRPGTDAALALGMLKVIIDEELYDKDFVKTWTNAMFLTRTDTHKLLRESDIVKGGKGENFVVWDKGRKDVVVWSSSQQAYLQGGVEPALEGSFEVRLADGSNAKCKTVWTALRERVSEFTPEKVAEICWVDGKDMANAARLYAKNKPSAFHWGVALDHVGPNAVPASRAVAALSCLTGNVDNPGGDAIARYAYNVSVYPFRGEATGGLTLPPTFNTKRSGVWKYPILKNFRSWGLSETALEQMLTGDPYPINVVWMQTCNPISGQSPEPAKLLAALRKMDFVAVVDAFMTPTAVACADLVLPVSTFIERWGLRSWWTPLQALVKATEPAGEAKADYEINLELAKRFNPKLPWKNVREMFNDYTKPAGVSYDELCDKVWMLAPKGHPSRPYYRYKTGLLRQDGKQGFATPSGKVEFWSCLLEDWGLEPLPYFEEPPFSPHSTPEMAKEYPLILGTGRRSYAFFHSEHRQIPWLREIDPDPIVEVNPETAGKLGVKNGDWVWLENNVGKCRRVAKVTPIVPPWMVEAPHSWWLPEKAAESPSLYGAWDVNANQLVPYGYIGDGGLGAPYKTMLCRMRKVEKGEM